VETWSFWNPLRTILQNPQSTVNETHHSTIQVVPESILRDKNKESFKSLSNISVKIPEYMKNEYKDDKFHMKDYTRKVVYEPYCDLKKNSTSTFLILGTLQSGKSFFFFSS
jgi:hypothetical protein